MSDRLSPAIVNIQENMKLLIISNDEFVRIPLHESVIDKTNIWERFSFS